MEKKYHLEVNATTGEQITREYTAAEYAQADLDAAAAAKAAADQKAAADALAALKASAKAKLVAGTKLTAEEAAVIVI